MQKSKTSKLHKLQARQRLSVLPKLKLIWRQVSRLKKKNVNLSLLDTKKNWVWP